MTKTIKIKASIAEKNWILAYAGMKLLLLSVLFLFPNIAPAHTGGIWITDGDTIKIQHQRVRLWGIDAPELGQTCTIKNIFYRCGLDAKRHLITFVAGREVACRAMGRDRYGRSVARCFAGDQDIGAEMVRAGWAQDYTRYSGGFYRQEEIAAHSEKRGIWAGAFQPAESWRRAYLNSKLN